MTDKIVWRCVRRDDLKCKATFKTTKNNEQPELINEHSHIADETDMQVKKTRQEMKENAASTLKKPNQIFTCTNAEVADEVKFACQVQIHVNVLSGETALFTGLETLKLCKN